MSDNPCLTCEEYDDITFCSRCKHNESLGQVYSNLDPYNAYSTDGQRVGRLCSCEDYPCCGH
jgi:hypothetical protein